MHALSADTQQPVPPAAMAYVPALCVDSQASTQFTSDLQRSLYLKPKKPPEAQRSPKNAFRVPTSPSSTVGTASTLAGRPRTRPRVPSPFYGSTCSPPCRERARSLYSACREGGPCRSLRRPS